MSGKLPIIRPKVPPPGSREATPLAAATPVAAVNRADDDPDDAPETRPGRFGQAIFRHAPLAGRFAGLSRPGGGVSGPARRTAGAPSPPPAWQTGVPVDDTQAEPLASKSFRPVKSKSDLGQAKDDSQSKEQTRGQEALHLALALDRLMLNGGPGEVLRLAPIQEDGLSPGDTPQQIAGVQRFSQRAIRALNRAASVPSEVRARKLLLSASVESLKEAKAFGSAERASEAPLSLADVREVLMAAVSELAANHVRHQAADDLRCLLPLLALNTGRPRTAAQMESADAKLQVMLRRMVS